VSAKPAPVAVSLVSENDEHTQNASAGIQWRWMIV
jgi:hypothetical protein